MGRKESNQTNKQANIVDVACSGTETTGSDL